MVRVTESCSAEVCALYRISFHSFWMQVAWRRVFLPSYSHRCTVSKLDGTDFFSHCWFMDTVVYFTPVFRSGHGDIMRSFRLFYRTLINRMRPTCVQHWSRADDLCPGLGVLPSVLGLGAGGGHLLPQLGSGGITRGENSDILQKKSCILCIFAWY